MLTPELLLLNPAAKTATASAIKAGGVNSGGGYVITDGRRKDWIEALFGAASGAGTVSPQKAMASIAWYFACVDKRATALSGLPWTIRPAGGGEALYDSNEDPPLPETLAFLSCLSSHLWRIEAALATEQRAYLLKPAARGKVTHLRWWNPQSITEEYRGADLTLKRAREGGSDLVITENSKPIALKDVMRFYQPGVYTELGASGTGRAVLPSADVLQSLTGFQGRYLDRGMIKALVFAAEGKLQDAERDRFKSWWKRFMMGWRNAGEIEVLNAKALTPHVIGEGFKDLEAVTLSTEKREAIAAAMGVPYSLLSSSAAHDDVKLGDQLEFYTFKVIPQSRLIADVLNEHFGLMGFAIMFHPERLAIFRRATLAIAESVAHLLNAGLEPDNDDGTIPGLPGWRVREGVIPQELQISAGGDGMPTRARWPKVRPVSQELIDDARAGGGLSF